MVSAKFRSFMSINAQIYMLQSILQIDVRNVGLKYSLGFMVKEVEAIAPSLT